ncbi:hypothetical protein [Chryseobacterium sp. NKUCC03_KSP]|uniref:hypothetical protein n=1 Tax=Chryseobacterium sp. NKUCC03_KSP TaxID=2842125 RepID=UPI001C5A7E7A|nr:hypothetical protein [Chryseobacterium sp. NKUCC03_KSP]MBW3521427.1 hypothetical protein [Chryseobacterium sp. NKUCC03_KSP]
MDEIDELNLIVAEIDGRNVLDWDVTLQIIEDTYLVLYGSGFLTPQDLTSHNAGDSFKNVAEARDRINKKTNPTSNCVLKYCPTDKEFFEFIKKEKSIKRLDVYSHAWLHGINLGGFAGKRNIDGIEIDGDKYDWSDDNQDKGKDLRRVEIHENLYLKSSETNELTSNLDESVFANDIEVYFWGCNAGGQLDSKGNHIGQNESTSEGIPLIKDPKESFAQAFADKLGKGNVYALVGKGVHAGSMFKTDERGKNYFEDGEMIPANISYNYGNKNTKKLKAIDYMKKFPL